MAGLVQFYYLSRPIMPRLRPPKLLRGPMMLATGRYTWELRAAAPVTAESERGTRPLP
jgi:hypothetical protein